MAAGRNLETLDKLMTHVIDEIKSLSTILEKQQQTTDNVEQKATDNIEKINAILKNLEADVKIFKVGSPQVNPHEKSLINPKEIKVREFSGDEQ